MVLFDANVWLYIYGPAGNRPPRNRSAYSLALRRIRSVSGRIVTDILVLSEFISARARFFYNQLPTVNQSEEFKEFRDSTKFKPVAERIVAKTRQILEKCELTETGIRR